MKSRLTQVDSNIRTSELFPRIRDAELGMKVYEKQLVSRLGEMKAKKQILRMNNHQEPEKSLFSSFMLDKDPRSAQYMPYDRVFFPKLPDMNKSDNIAFVPDVMDNFWTLGFQDTKSTTNFKRKRKN